MQALPCRAWVMEGNLDAKFHRDPGSKELHFSTIPDCALLQDLPHPARMRAGYFNTEFHQEPGSKELHFASIPDCALPG
jgi:hypothetical protein